MIDDVELAERHGGRASIPDEAWRLWLVDKKRRAQNWAGPGTLWIIRGDPSPLVPGAEVIVLDPGADECRRRARADGRPDQTLGWIDKWYRLYSKWRSRQKQGSKSASPRRGLADLCDLTPSGLVEPSWLTGPDWVKTLGPEVADLCDLVGFGPDPEQSLLLDHLFGMDDRGLSAAFELAVVVARQNLKTGLFKQAVLGWLHITDQRLVVWSAHEFRTSREAFRDLDELHAAHPALSRRVKAVHRANGDESIELVSGQRVLFRARTKAGGRGLSGDRVVLDEAFALRPDHMGALLPTLSARPDPQIVYGSSAGLAESDVLRGIRDRGRAGSSPRLVYAEWGAPRRGCADDRCSHDPGRDGCALDDPDLLRAANPALGRRITVDYVADERRALPPLEFARERLGWWDDPPQAADVFPPGAWDSCAGRPVPDGAPVQALAVAVSFDQTRAAVAAATHVDGVTYIKPLRSGPGTSWLVDEATSVQAAHQVPVVVDAKGPASAKVAELEQAGVDLHVVTSDEVCEACASMMDTVTDATFGHDDYPELARALEVAVQRPVGDRWAWGRRQSTSDISVLEAVTLAAWKARLPDPAVDVWGFWE